MFCKLEFTEKEKLTVTPSKLEDRLYKVGNKLKTPIEGDIRTIYDLLERLIDILGDEKSEENKSEEVDLSKQPLRDYDYKNLRQIIESPKNKDETVTNTLRQNTENIGK